MAKVFVGDGEQYPSDSGGIILALQHGHRHLVFTVPNNQIHQTIDLDALLLEPSPSLRFEGAGPHGTNLQRQTGFGDAPMFSWDGRGASVPISMHWTGMSLQGMYCNPDKEKPGVCPDPPNPAGEGLANNMKIRFMQDSLFEDCGFHRASGSGLVIGEAGDAERVTFRRCEFDKNGLSGLVLQNARDYVIEDVCFFHRNAKRPDQDNAGLLIDDAVGAVPGYGLIWGNLFERDDDAPGVQFGTAHSVKVIANRWVHSPIAMTVNTEGCSFEDNSKAQSQSAPLFSWRNPENTYERNDP